jgi:hypothetical protein
MDTVHGQDCRADGHAGAIDQRPRSVVAEVGSRNLIDHLQRQTCDDAGADRWGFRDHSLHRTIVGRVRERVLVRQPTQTADAHIQFGRAPRANITDVIVECKSVGGEPQFLVNEPDERIQIKNVEVLAAGLQGRIGIPLRRVGV